MDDSKDLSPWERGAPAPQCLSEILERQSGAGAPRSREREEPVFFKIWSQCSFCCQFVNQLSYVQKMLLLLP